MLKSEALHAKMYKHFARWMDIRKRNKKSDGGKLLLAVAEEVADIQEAINDYKKDFFIDGYADRQDEVVAFLYKGLIGNVDTETIKLTSPSMEIAADVASFYKATGTAHFEDGYLFFRTEDITEGTERVSLSIDEFPTTIAIEKIHVWNVFDEFAVFLGISRHERETNKELEQRILSVFSRPMNSTETGIRNAILNELINLDPSLVEEEVLISRPTPENLIKPYKDFGSVLEKLDLVNRDIYRTKRWDVDSWNYAFKSVEYIPHAWDVMLDVYQNGVGFKDDLKVTITAPEDTTNARISFYSESETVIQEYIKQREIKEDINLGLVRYDNTLQAKIAKYRVEAAESRDLSSESIWIEASERFEGEESRYLQEIVNESESKDITVRDGSKIEDGKRYELTFKPVSNIGSMIIDKCDLLVGETRTSLLTEKGGFLINGNGQLYNKNVRFFGNRRHEFTNYQNVVNGALGIEVDDLSAISILSLDVPNMQNERVWLSYGGDRAKALPKHLLATGFQEELSGNYSSSVSGSEFQFSGRVNGVSMNIESGNFVIVTTVDGISGEPFSGTAPYLLNIEDSMETRDIVVKVAMITSVPCVISDIRYSEYELRVGVEQQNLVVVNDGVYLPSSPTNQLYITMKAGNGYAPRVNYLHIGQKLDGQTYSVIIPAGVGQKIDIKTKCLMTTAEIDAEGVVVPNTLVSGYEPYRFYTANTEVAYLKLDMSSYLSVASVQSANARLETIGTSGNMSYMLRIRKGESLAKVSVTGDRTASRKIVTLAEALSAESTDSIYISNLHKSFIVANESGARMATISQSSLESTTTESFSITGLPEDISCYFEIVGSEKAVHVGESYTGRFKSVYFMPKNSTSYVAYNEMKMISSELRNVGIVDVFHPFLPTNQNMIYVVSSMDTTGDTQVKFESDGGFVEASTWSVGRKPLRILWALNMQNPVNYNQISMSIRQQFLLNETIPLQPSYTLENGEIVELAKYMITPPEGMSISYRQRKSIDSIETSPEFYSVETIVREEDGFNKLKYANVDEVIHMGTSPWTGESAPVNNSSFSIMKEEGIVVWADDQIPVGYPIYIVYTIKLPDAIKVSLSSLYKIIEYKTEAYKEIGHLDAYNQANGDKLSISHVGYYSVASKFVVSCDRAGFEGVIENGTVTFRRDVANNVVAVQTGFFYADGQEYYMFASEASDIINQFQNVTLTNVVLDDNEMVLNKETKNYVRNSWMELGNAADIFGKNFEEDDSVVGISRLNSITACGSFNRWNAFGANLYLAPGLNGTGIKVEPLVENGYAFIEITDSLIPNTLLSFYLSGSAEAYIGKEKKYKDMSFPRSMSVELFKKISRSIVDANIMEISFSPEDGFRHYLVIKGAGIVDDLILEDQSRPRKKIHTKLIDSLNLSVEEKISNDYVSRLHLTGKGSIESGAEISWDGKIINSSNIDWGITKTRSYNEPSSWARCQLTKVNLIDGICYTAGTQSGTIETDPIYIGDRRIIENIVFEINDVLFDNMKGFVTRIKMSETHGGEYRTVSTHRDNIGSVRGSYLLPYVKFVIEMPAGKVINDISIYTEYKSTADAAPIEISSATGSFMTEALDTHYSAKYKVKGIGVESISNINDVLIYIRGSKEDAKGEVWTEWKEVQLTGDFDIKNSVQFDGYRFFQVRVALKTKKAFVKITHIDLGVV